MEDHLHEDKLDDYVRKSFEAYEEDPAPDMWGRIEGDMPPAAPLRARRFSLWPYRWQAAAAALILVLTSTLLCEHLYFTERIKTLSEQLSTAPPAPAQASGPAETKGDMGPGVQPAVAERREGKSRPPSSPAPQRRQDGESIDHPSHESASVEGGTSLASMPGEAAASRKEGQRPVPSDLAAELPRAANRPEDAKESAAGGGDGSGVFSQKNAPPALPNGAAAGGGDGAGIFSQKNAPPVLPNEVAAGGGDGSGVFSQKNAPPALPNEVAAGGGDGQGDFSQKSAPLMPLAVRPAGLLPDLPSVVLRPQYPVQVHKGLSGWYVGAQAMWLSAQERSRSVAIRPNGRPVFASRQESADQSAWWGLRAGKKIGSRWSIETGIGYQRSERKASHQPRFRFADGLLGGGPGGPRAFSYEVPTYGGTAEVTLRMETTTPSSPPTPDEAVPLKISTTERSEVLRVPLLAAYRLGGKRWQAHLKAGVLVNVTLKQELDLAARVSQSSRFRPVDGQDGYTLQLKRAGNLGWGYALAAGTEYRLNRRWSVVAEPMLVGDFVRKDGAGQTLPQHTAWGLNAGVQMYF